MSGFWDWLTAPGPVPVPVPVPAPVPAPRVPLPPGREIIPCPNCGCGQLPTCCCNPVGPSRVRVVLTNHSGCPCIDGLTFFMFRTAQAGWVPEQQTFQFCNENWNAVSATIRMACGAFGDFCTDMPPPSPCSYNFLLNALSTQRRCFNIGFSIQTLSPLAVYGLSRTTPFGLGFECTPIPPGNVTASCSPFFLQVRGLTVLRNDWPNTSCWQGSVCPDGLVDITIVPA